MTRRATVPFAAVAACCLLLFVLISQFQLPLLRRGMDARGLYRFVDEIRFLEVGVGTLVGVFALARVVRLPMPTACLLSLASACVNIALLIADVRMHNYSDWVEMRIAIQFGSPWLIWLYSGALFALGLGCGVWAWRRECMRSSAGAVPGA